MMKKLLLSALVLSVMPLGAKIIKRVCHAKKSSFYTPGLIGSYTPAMQKGLKCYLYTVDEKQPKDLDADVKAHIKKLLSVNPRIAKLDKQIKDPQQFKNRKSLNDDRARLLKYRRKIIEKLKDLQAFGFEHDMQLTPLKKAKGTATCYFFPDTLIKYQEAGATPYETRDGSFWSALGIGHYACLKPDGKLVSRGIRGKKIFQAERKQFNKKSAITA